MQPTMRPSPSEYAARTLIYNSQIANRQIWEQAIGYYQSSETEPAAEFEAEGSAKRKIHSEAEGHKRHNTDGAPPNKRISTLIQQIFPNESNTVRDSIYSYLTNKNEANLNKFFKEILSGEMLSPDRKTAKMATKVRKLEKQNQLIFMLLSTQQSFQSEFPLKTAYVNVAPAPAPSLGEPIPYWPNPTSEQHDLVKKIAEKNRNLEAEFNKRRLEAFGPLNAAIDAFNQAADTLNQKRFHCHNLLSNLLANLTKGDTHQIAYITLQKALEENRNAEETYHKALEEVEKVGAAIPPGAAFSSLAPLSVESVEKTLAKMQV